VLSQGSQRLADDHQSLDELLTTVHEACRNGDVRATHFQLDLFWARLAVHIRAEHLHLFPAILDGLSTLSDDPSSRNAQAIVDKLKADHDFFMYELARAVIASRELRPVSNQTEIAAGLDAIKEKVAQVEERLGTHNEIEEGKIYRRVSAVLGPEAQIELAAKIDAELARRPPRFNSTDW
jgi:hemerythrin superfamily protein